MSNRFLLVEREFIHPSIEGVDFGGKCWCIARSPAAVLMWVFGHSWSLNGSQRYAEPCLILLPSRTDVRNGTIKYQHIADGGRLTAMRLSAPTIREKLREAFGSGFESPLNGAIDGARLWVGDAKRRRTLLIEGGGPKLMPSRMHGEEEYKRWRDLPDEDRGFLLPAARRHRDKHSLGYRP